MGILSILILSLLYVPISAGAAEAIPTQADRSYKVLLISSSGSDSAVLEIMDAFKSEWEHRDIKLNSFTHRHPSVSSPIPPSPAFNRLSLELLAERYRYNPPDLILAHLNEGLELARLFRDANCPEVPILCFEVTDPMWETFSAAGKVFRIGLPRYDHANIRLAGKILPRLEKVFVFIRMDVDIDFENIYAGELQEEFPNICIHVVSNPDFAKAELIIRSAGSGDSAIVNLNPGWADETGRFLFGEEYIEDLVKRFDIPVFQFLRTGLGSGLTGGAGLRRSDIGRAAGSFGHQMIIEGKILNRDLTWPDLEHYYTDYNMLVRYGSSVKLLPEGTEVINLPPTFWIRYKRLIQFTALAMFVIIGFLLFRLRIRRREQRLLAVKNQELEDTVLLRTSELRTSNEELSAINENLRVTMRRMEEMRDALVQKEREALLGRLTLGMANELNSPLNAIRSANESHRFILSEAEQTLEKVLFSLSGEQRSLFSRFLPILLSKPTDFGSGGDREMKDAHQRIKLFDSQAPRSITEIFANTRLHELPDNDIRLLMEKENRNLLDVLNQFALIYSSICIIEAAVERSVLVIKTIGEYTSGDEADTDKTLVLLEDSIEVAVKNLENRWPRSVKLERVYSPVPQVMASKALLVRLWEHLIRNALQAMPEGGVLKIVLEYSGGLVTIRVEDEGVGVDPDLGDRIFEPFVTTKPYAEGLGLGLANCRKILDTLGGSITYLSREEGTSFIVALAPGEEYGESAEKKSAHIPKHHEEDK